MLASSGSSGGLFGQPQSGAQSKSSGLFQSQPAFGAGTGGGLFGSQQTNNNQQQQGQTSSIFGQSLSSQQQQQQQQPQQPNAGGLSFGSNAQTSSGMGFGASATKPGMFGAQNPTNSNPNAFGSQPQQQPPVITPFTRPGDLPESIQKSLESMDSYIHQQTQLSEDLTHAMVDHKKLITSIPRDVQLLRFKLTSAKETLKFDDGQLAKLKGLIDTNYDDAELLSEVINQPRKYDRLLPYFSRVASCDSRLDQLTLAMRDVQQTVTTEEFGNRSTFDEQGIRALPDALREEYMYFMSLSDRVAELHRHMKENGEGEALDDLQL